MTAALPLCVFAQDAEVPRAELDGGSVAGALGANVAAGSANQQANVGVIAAATTAVTVGSLSQSLALPAAGQSAGAEAAIAEGAFAGSHGWIATNVAAGVGNQQANLAGVGIGFTGQVANATMLSQTRAPMEEPAEGPEVGRADIYQSHIGEGAFADASGLVQVNVSAGDANTSANVFALTLPGQ